MTVVKIDNLRADDSQIFYMKKYTGKAVLLMPGGTTELDIKFTIEISPFGTVSVNVTILTEMNYPLLPVKKALCDFIKDLYKNDRLPIV